MSTNHFKYMTQALDAKRLSPHRNHKVGSLLIQNDKTTLPGYNYWPAALLETIGRDTKLGDASTSLHAETATLIQSTTPTKDADIYITDLPCPNCAKILAESGMKNIYINSNAKNTLLGQKIKPFFEQVSLLIFNRAKIKVYEIDIKRNLCTPYTYSPKPILDKMDKPYRNKENSLTCLTTDNRPLEIRTKNAPGLTQEDITYINTIQDKYAALLQPFNILFATCAKEGWKVQDGTPTFSQTPTAREFVNMIGYGITSITIENPNQCRDKHGLKALKQLQDYKILEIKH